MNPIFVRVFHRMTFKVIILNSLVVVVPSNLLKVHEMMKTSE